MESSVQLSFVRLCDANCEEQATAYSKEDLQNLFQQSNQEDPGRTVTVIFSFKEPRRKSTSGDVWIKPNEFGDDEVAFYDGTAWI